MRRYFAIGIESIKEQLIQVAAVLWPSEVHS